MAGHIARAPAKGRLTARPICWKRPLVFRCAVIAAYAFSAGCSYVAAMAISIRTRGHAIPTHDYGFLGAGVKLRDFYPSRVAAMLRGVAGSGWKSLESKGERIATRAI